MHMEQHSIRSEIKTLLKKRNAVLLAHNYMRDEVQEIADITGDSLARAMKAEDGTVGRANAYAASLRPK